MTSKSKLRRIAAQTGQDTPRTAEQFQQMEDWIEARKAEKAAELAEAEADPNDIIF